MSVVAWAVPQDHLLSLGISFSILCAKVQSAFLYLSLSMALSHLSAIISYLALPSEALSSAVTSLALFARPHYADTPHRPEMEACIRDGPENNSESRKEAAKQGAGKMVIEDQSSAFRLGHTQ